VPKACEEETLLIRLTAAILSMERLCVHITLLQEGKCMHTEERANNEDEY
jgi:hypothetical protein